MRTHSGAYVAANPFGNLERSSLRHGHAGERPAIVSLSRRFVPGRHWAFYLPIALMLLGLIFRGVAFEFRQRSQRMRPVWDCGFFLGSLVAAFVQGAAIGRMVQELPVVDGRYAGGAFEWVTPFSMLCGAGLVLGYAMLGAAWLALKTEGDLRDWAYRRLDWLLAAVVVVLIAVFAFALATQMRVLDRWLNDPRFVVLQIIGVIAIVGLLIGPAARRRALCHGDSAGRCGIPEARRQLLAVHDPVLRHSAAGGRSSAVARIPILGRRHRRVSGRADLHQHRLLDLPG